MADGPDLKGRTMGARGDNKGTAAEVEGAMGGGTPNSMAVFTSNPTLDSFS